MKIAIIPCQNGLGHLVRSFYIFKKLTNKKFEVDFFYDKNTKNDFTKKVTDFVCEKKLFNFANGNYQKKKYSSITFKNYDKIYVDNLYEKVFKFKKNLIIFANFFWFSIYNKRVNYYKSIINNKKNIHKVFTNYLFFHNSSFLNIQKFEKIGFFGNFIRKKFKKRDSILISIGTADFLGHEKLIKEILSYLNMIKTNKIYLDPKIFKMISNPEKNICLANYTSKMYQELAVAIIKPGFSTIENCLRHGVTPIAFSKNLNSEFNHNSRVIKKNNLGYISNDMCKTIKLAKKICNSTREQKKKFIIHSKLKWNGEENLLKELKK